MSKMNATYDRELGPTRPFSCLSMERRWSRPAVQAVLIFAVMQTLAAPALVRAAEPAAHPVPPLRTTDLFALAKASGEYFKAVPDAATLNMDRIVAFEESPRFVYLAGKTDSVLRRIVLLKPRTFVVEDRVQVTAAGMSVKWTLYVRGKPNIDGTRFSAKVPGGEISAETVLPKKASLQVARPIRDGGDSAIHGVEITVKTKGPEARLLHVIQVGWPDEVGSGPRCELAQDGDERRLTVGTAAATLTLSLPAERDAAGTIAIAGADGQSVLKERLLPSGVMPHGEEGVRLLRRWDTPYHGERRPGWDTGRVAPELKKLVEQEPAKRGRAVVLGCGTGTNAIYLASKGFDVIGVDVAPSALIHAERKAREAGVRVRWVVADVLALPELEPVDLIFDRGCYHHVRQYNAAGYVQSVRRLSRPGSRLLLLAGSAKETRRRGPPKIKEEEIRGDFSELFEFEWFRDIRFDSVNPDAEGPMAWSVLMRCK